MVLPNQQNSVDHNKSEIDEFVSNAFEQNCVLLLGDTPVELQTYSSFACINNSFCFSRFEKAIPKLAKGMHSAMEGKYEPIFLVCGGKCYLVVAPKSPTVASVSPSEVLDDFIQACQSMVDSVMFRRNIDQYSFEQCLPWEPYEKWFAEGIFILASLLNQESCSILFSSYGALMHEHGKELLRPKLLLSSEEKSIFGKVKQINYDDWSFLLQIESEVLMLHCNTEKEYQFLYKMQEAQDDVELIVLEYTDSIGILPSKIEKKFVRIS